MTVGEMVGANIRRYREIAGLSQEALGYRAEVHRTSVSLYETGSREPKPAALARLAGALGVDPGRLYEGIRWVPGEEVPGRLIVGRRYPWSDGEAVEEAR
jgi:transcriptional regulator with XRE-family HTH domain